MATQLTPLPNVQRLSPLCIRILGGNPGKFTLQGTNTYLLGRGPRRILIDTGEGRPAWIASLRSTLAKEKATVDTVLVSHWHHDHTGGIADVLSAAPEAAIHKYDPELGRKGIVDGQKFHVDGVNLTAVHTPGHTKDHMVFVLAEEDAMFTADNVLGQGTAVFEDMSEYLRSLHQMRELFSGRAYPGHGPVVEDGPGKITEYIEHRQQRVDQVLQTMRGDDDGIDASGTKWSAMDLVKIIYSDVPVALHQAACNGVLQILEKLASDGTVIKQDRGLWQVNRKKSTL
ncbi:metallo-beta-lactamase domain protein, putative [Metarhizium acridum CQMa 102]|uniref:Metallo-beta-lactamase domain protein, putative n=1 Tax=Metarhizium acridum (strain CQMa 102) TaxID=655827 RepID=E9DQW6_METAQ|nr:metallo-beta-lactamase domain protein, putative [Metarhizium acridum CQMa 102]EFY93644.1 metallo-beta-lactamase domain protein, putative [Metarhizium acridum CQMa 102]